MSRLAKKFLQMPNGDEIEFYGKTFYGVCTSTASTVAKTVFISNFTGRALYEGTRIAIRFNNGNSVFPPTLNISNTGAKTINFMRPDEALLPAGSVVDFVFFNDQWQMIGVRDQGWYGLCSTAAATQAKVVSVTKFTSPLLTDGTHVTVRFYNAQDYDGTPTLNVTSTGAKNIQTSVGVNAGKGAWKAGAIITFYYYNNAWVMLGGGQAISSFNNDVGYLTLSTLPTYDGSVV